MIMNEIELLKEHKIFCIKPYDLTVSLLENWDEGEHIIWVKKYYHDQISEAKKLGKFISFSHAKNAIQDINESYNLQLVDSKIDAENVFEEAIKNLENYTLNNWNQIKEEIDEYIKEQQEKEQREAVESMYEGMEDYYDKLHEENMKEIERESNIVVTLKVEASGYIHIPINLNIDDEEYLNYIKNLASEDEKSPEDYILSKFKEANKSNEELFYLFEDMEIYYDSFSEIKYNEIYYEYLSNEDDKIGKKVIYFDDFKTLENDSTLEIENYYQERSDKIKRMQKIKGIQGEHDQPSLLHLIFRIKAKVKSTMYILINTMDKSGDYYEEHMQFYDGGSYLASPLEFIQDKISEYKYDNKLIFNNGDKTYEDYSEIEFRELWRGSSYKYMVGINLNEVLGE
jgi:hypothetical protein